MTEPDQFQRYEAAQRAAREGGTSPATSGRSAAVGGLVLLATVAVVLIVLQKSGVIGDSRSTPEAYTCGDLASEAVRISAEQQNALAPKLLEVRGTRITEDHRTDYAVPAASSTDDAVVLQCRGTGAYASGETAPVDVRLTVDSDSEFFVYLERVG